MCHKLAGMAAGVWLGSVGVAVAGPAPCEGECVLCGDNAAAYATRFQVVEGVLQCEVAYGYDCVGYVVETAPDERVPMWREVGPVWSPSERAFQYGVTSGCDRMLRLVEIGSDGRRRVLAQTVKDGGEGTELRNGRERSVAELTRDSAERLERLRSSGVQRRALRSGETIVVYGRSGWIDEASFPCGALWEYLGYTVLKEPTDTMANVRQDVKASIAGYAQAGVSRFLLIGDGSDSEGYENRSLWTGEWANVRNEYEQSGYHAGAEIIPTFLRADGQWPPYQNMACAFPYYTTDQPYADVDDDGRLDVIVTRWPAATHANVVAMANKVIAYTDGSRFAPLQGPSMGTVIFGYDVQTATSGIVARVACRAGVERMRQRLSEGGTCTVELVSQNWGSCANLTSRVLGYWNMPTSAVVLAGTLSSRYAPAMHLSKMCIPGFDHTVLSGGVQGFVFATTCEAAGFTLHEGGQGLAVCEEVMRSPDGAIGWFGPTSGSWHRSHLLVQEYLFDALREDWGRAIGEAWLVAQQRLYDDYGPGETLRSIEPYELLGDPVSALRSPLYPTGVEVDRGADPRILDIG